MKIRIASDYTTIEKVDATNFSETGTIYTFTMNTASAKDRYIIIAVDADAGSEVIIFRGKHYDERIFEMDRDQIGAWANLAFSEIANCFCFDVPGQI